MSIWPRILRCGQSPDELDASGGVAELKAMPGEKLAVMGVHVLPMDADELADHTVVVGGGRVVAMGPSAQVDIGSAVVVDGRGRYLIPGLADMHVYLWGLGEDSLNLANGVTTVRNMWGDPMHLTWQRQIASGRRLGPRIITTTPGLASASSRQGHSSPAAPALRTADHAEPVVADMVRRGYHQVRVLPSLKAADLKAVAAAAGAAGMPVVGECPELLALEDGAASGIGCFEHLAGVEARHIDPVTGYLDRSAVRRLGSFLADRQVWTCPTLVGDRERDDAGPCVEGLRYLRPGVWSQWDRLTRSLPARGGNAVPTATERRRRREIVRLLHGQGAPLLAGTGASNPYMVPGFALREELANLAEAGLTPLEALRSATVEAARFMREDDWGIVRVGARADLVLLRHSPLDDLAALGEIEAVIVAGRLLTRADLDALLASEAVHTQQR